MIPEAFYTYMVVTLFQNRSSKECKAPNTSKLKLGNQDCVQRMWLSCVHLKGLWKDESFCYPDCGFPEPLLHPTHRARF